MTLPVSQTKSSLPAYLQNLQASATSVNEALSARFTSSGHPRIGIKGGKWRIVENDVEEVVDSTKLQVVIVGANRSRSKVYYESKYDPKADIKAPDCWSDNGSGPSSHASNPQSDKCAVCPHHAWGSKVSAQGKPTRACSDYQKLAVVLADDIGRNVFELRIPAASIKEFEEVMKKILALKLPIPSVLFELSFDPNSDFPKIIFKAARYLDEGEYNEAVTWVNHEDSIRAFGGNDVVASRDNLAITDGSNVVYSSNSVAPIVSSQIQRQDHAPVAQQSGSTDVKRRGRPAKTETTGVVEQQLTLDLPQAQTPAQATQVEPQRSNPNLDALLEGIL